MPIETVRKTVPDLYLEHLAVTVSNGYRKGARLSKKSFKNENIQTNSMPWNRRGFIEEGMLDVPVALEDDVSIAEVRNSWWWHVEITIGSVVIVQAIAPDIDKNIRPSNHKSTLALYTQMRLFPVDGQDGDETKRLFAALTHGPVPGDPTRPAFAAIQVPKIGEDGKINGYYPGRIDLMDEYPHAFTPIIPASNQEIIEDSAFPELLDEQQAGE